MSDYTGHGKEAQNQKAVGDESLLPQQTRIFNRTSWLAAWVGSSIFIGVFMLGGSLVPPTGQMNLLQATVCLVLALSIVSVCMVVNGKAGNKYGIPFVAQARPCFGALGAYFPMVLRAVPAICWYGIQSWVGAVALNELLNQFFGFDQQYVCFVFFQLLQVALSVLGFQGIKWLENIGSVIIIGSLIYMLYVIVAESQTQISANLIDIEGTWGMPFWAGTTVFVGIFTTWMINSSDYSREVTKFKRNMAFNLFSIQWLGIVPPVFFMAIIGLLAANKTGQWDPIAVFVSVIDNPVVLVVALFFIALAQVTTNIMGNVIPPAYVIMEIFKLPYKKAAAVVGLLGLLTFPWLLASADWFTLFIKFYSVFLGPIFAVMVVDYYLIRRQTLDLTALYDTSSGPYHGVNWCGILSIAVGAGFAMLNVDLSWYISLAPAGLVYYITMKYQLSRNNRFCHGTDLYLKDKDRS